MENKGKEQNTQDESPPSKGAEFLKQLREMPYDNSEVGKVFIRTHYKRKTEIKDATRKRK